MGEKYDLDRVEEIYIRSMINIFNILFDSDETDVELVKNSIKKSLINPESYNNYQCNKFQIMTSIISCIIDNDMERIVLLFLSSTFLLESVLRINEKCGKSNMVSNEIQRMIDSYVEILN